jgi:hypothetical protein
LSKQHLQTHHPDYNNFVNADLTQETAVLIDNHPHHMHKDGHLNDESSFENEIIRERLLNNPITEYSKYYASDAPKPLFAPDDGDSTEDHQTPQAFLIQPYARKGTKRTKFGGAPCGGGILGKSRFVATPGENINVQWIIQDPVPSGKCQIKISKGHPDDEISYEHLEAVNLSDKYSGKFDCGDEEKTVDEANIKLPDTTCTE